MFLLANLQVLSLNLSIKTGNLKLRLIVTLGNLKVCLSLHLLGLLLKLCWCWLRRLLCLLCCHLLHLFKHLVNIAFNCLSTLVASDSKADQLGKEWN